MCPANDGIEGAEYLFLLFLYFEVHRQDLLAGIYAALQLFGYIKLASFSIYNDLYMQIKSPRVSKLANYRPYDTIYPLNTTIILTIPQISYPLDKLSLSSFESSLTLWLRD